MTNEEHSEWAIRYASTFGMTSDADSAMLAGWFPVFRACNYTLVELDAALISVATNPPKFRQEHLPAVHGAIRSRRQYAERRRPKPADDRWGECADCGETGRAIVPHPQHVVDGQWVASMLRYRPLATVLCHCAKGRQAMVEYDSKSQEYRDRIPRPMTFEAYLRIAPRWRDMLAERDESDRAVRDAEALAEHADRVSTPLAGVMRRLTERANAGRGAAAG